MVGGAEEPFARAAPVIASYAKACRLLGAAGSGQLAKMMNQICIAGVVEGLAEAIHFGTSAGLDVAAVIDVISKGAAQSWQMENRHKTMLAGKYDFGFAVDWMRKDLRIVLGEARGQRRASAADGARRPVLRRSAGDGRQPLGHLEPAGPIGTLIQIGPQCGLLEQPEEFDGADVAVDEFVRPRAITGIAVGLPVASISCEIQPEALRLRGKEGPQHAVVADRLVGTERGAIEELEHQVHVVVGGRREHVVAARHGLPDIAVDQRPRIGILADRRDGGSILLVDRQQEVVDPRIGVAIPAALPFLHHVERLRDARVRLLPVVFEQPEGQRQHRHDLEDQRGDSRRRGGGG